MSDEDTREQSDKPARKKQQRSLQTQQKLIDAALEAFSINGYKGTSTRDIAERAGVHHPLITYHFKSKDELWRAAADRMFKTFNVEINQAFDSTAGQCARTRVAAVIRAYVNSSAAQPELHKFIIQMSNQPSPRHDWLVETHLKPMFEAGEREIRLIQDRGRAPPGDPAMLFNLILVCAGGLFALSNEVMATSGLNMGLQSSIDSLADMIISIFLPNDAPCPPGSV